jgi:hypothetical protein
VSIGSLRSLLERPAGAPILRQHEVSRAAENGAVPIRANDLVDIGQARAVCSNDLGRRICRVDGRASSARLERSQRVDALSAGPHSNVSLSSSNGPA